MLTSALHAQSPVIDLLDWEGEVIPGFYHKDVHNKLNPFAGTWLYTNGNTSLKIVLVKKVMVYDGEFYEDLLIGEYRYVENGVEKFNSLADLNAPLTYMTDHKIYGNHIPRGGLTPFDEEISGETRFKLIFEDNRVAKLNIRKTTVSGQEAIQIFKVNLMPELKFGDLLPPASAVPEGFYTLIKQ